MKLQLTHHTRYDYLPAVETAQHMAYLQPLQTAQQQVLSHQFDISPTPASLSRTTDVYGNTRCFFSLQTPHRVLDVVARHRGCRAAAAARRPPQGAEGGRPRRMAAGASDGPQRRAPQQRELGSYTRTVSLPIGWPI